MERNEHASRTERSENLVFKGQQPQRLGALPAPGLVVECNRPPGADGPDRFEEGLDYLVDYKVGTVARTEASRIPDWRNHPAYGLESFDHRELPFYSNAGFTCSIRYRAATGGAAAEPPPEPGAGLLKTKLSRLHERLTVERSAVCAIYGDSISTGAEASRPELSFFGRFIADMRSRYPEAAIRSEMKAIGGETSGKGIERIGEVVGTGPDLVIIAYGMNDQNRNPDGSNATSVQEYERIIREMIAIIRSRTQADVLLVTPCLPNPRWLFASDNVREYAAALRRIAADTGAALADVQAKWEAELAAGKSHESLLLNNVNHPNDYGHHLYYSVLRPFLD